MKLLRSLFKAVLALVALAVLGIGGVLAYYLVVLPENVAVPDLKVDVTPERVARGEYLANAVFGCMYCHSGRDWTKFAGPVVPGTLGKGGEVFDQKQGLSGRLVSPNLTPYHLGEWSDGEIYRAITSGLHRDGYSMFPLMPWDAYLWLKTEDVYAIIAYLRSLPAIESTPGSRAPSLLMRIIANSRVRPAEPWEVDESDPLSRGEYIAVIAGCRFCHTTPRPRNLGNFNNENVAGFWGGGMVIAGHGTPLPASNISPDPEQGIGNWTREQFIARFRAYGAPAQSVTAEAPNTEHAWTEYARMSDGDLADVYTYLMAQRPRPRPAAEAADPRLPLEEARRLLIGPKPLRYVTQTIGGGKTESSATGMAVSYALAPPDDARRLRLHFGPAEYLERAEVVGGADAGTEVLFDRSTWKGASPR